MKAMAQHVDGVMPSSHAPTQRGIEGVVGDGQILRMRIGTAMGIDIMLYQPARPYAAAQAGRYLYFMATAARGRVAFAAADGREFDFGEFCTCFSVHSNLQR